jgi:uncharacterized membrane protein
MIRSFDTPRQRQARRRSATIAVIVAVGFAGGLIGQLSARDAVGPVPAGPFSYFPN